MNNVSIRLWRKKHLISLGGKYNEKKLFVNKKVIKKHNNQICQSCLFFHGKLGFAEDSFWGQKTELFLPLT
jgi:hypothetical protein